MKLLEVSNIGLLNWLKGMFDRDYYISEWDSLVSDYATTHLKQSALDTVIGKIINASSLVEFKTTDPELSRALNSRPNQNENASEFRAKIIKKLLLEGECLIIEHNNHFYVADSFHVDKKVMKENWYTNIIIDDMKWNMSYKSIDVYHLKYHNEQLMEYMESLDKSYGQLFSRLVNVHMREGQLRVYAKFKMLTKRPDESVQDQLERSKRTLKDYLQDIKDQIENESVAILPRQEDYDVDEKSANYVGRSVDELGKIQNLYVKQVADILQVPPLIFSGELADVSEHNNNFVRWCIRPLMGIIADEFNAKYFTDTEYKKGNKLTVNTIWVIYNSEFEMAKDARTMIESAVWTVDDVLELQGKPRERTKITTQRYLTKNMAPLNEDGTVQDGKK